MDRIREALEREIADLQCRAEQLSGSHEWVDQCEQALLATAIVLHQNMLADVPRTVNSTCADH